MTDAIDLEEVEAAVLAALERGTDEGLRVLGYGEITLVLGWPVADPRWACKRLPMFPSEAAVDRYRTRFDEYLALLQERGVEPVPSEFRTAAATGGRVAGYVVQPVLPPGSLGPDVLRAADPDPGHPLVQAVCAAVHRVADDHTGLDGQISNWARVDSGSDDDTTGGRVQYLDVTTPMIFDDGGHLRLDLDLFLAAYPWPLRAPIRRFVVPGVVGSYREPRHILLDLAANLLKERLHDWVQAFLEVTNATVTPAITAAEVQKYYASDARLWELMLRLRRADRWWQQRVRRRPYPFLLPGPIAR